MQVWFLPWWVVWSETQNWPKNKFLTTFFMNDRTVFIPLQLATSLVASCSIKIKSHKGVDKELLSPWFPCDINTEWAALCVDLESSRSNCLMQLISESTASINSCMTALLMKPEQTKDWKHYSTFFLKTTHLLTNFYIIWEVWITRKLSWCYKKKVLLM